MDSQQIAILPWWQIAGAMIIVLSLLMLGLRALQRWQPGMRQGGGARLLSVHRLGPRRELQRLRVGGAVHTIYRHDGAMVLLGSEPWEDHSQDQSDGSRVAPPSAGQRLKVLLAAAGGRARTRLFTTP